MIIQELRVQHLRNLIDICIHPGNGINLIYGDNASGKTSIIEAIYLLGRGKTFRDSRQENIIQEGANETVVFARIEANKRIDIGIKKDRRSSEIRINGHKENKISTLATVCPVKIITPRSHEIIEGGPELRRRFIDWGVFHVEPSYKNDVVNYLKLIKERNRLLKADHTLLSHWDDAIEKYADNINLKRQKYLELLFGQIETVLSHFDGLPMIEFDFRQGWDKENTLSKALEMKRKQDIARGFTSVGPHRADLIINAKGKQVKSRLSRGQQKLVVTAMIVAQANLMVEQVNTTPLILIDDLAAELDDKNRRSLVDLLRAMDGQVYITSTRKDLIRPVAGDAVFHVEHGRISEE